MRGDDQQRGHLFSYLSPEQRVPADHPLRAIRQMTDEALRQLSPQFEAIFPQTGRRPVPPEQLLRVACCKRATRCAANACSSSSSRTACCLADSWTWAWTTRCGRRLRSRRTASTCSRATSPGSSSRRRWPGRVDADCCFRRALLGRLGVD